MKKYTQLICFMCALVMMFMMGCGGVVVDNDGPVDDSKSLLKIYNYDGGYGHEWLSKLEKRFEETYKDTSFEPGKKGVDLKVSNQKNSAANVETLIKSAEQEVFFIGLADMHELINKNLLLDITDVVTKQLPGETKTLGDKLYPEQEVWYAKDGRYYGLPFQTSGSGIMVNYGLLEEEQALLYNSDGTLKKGPDGISDTHDDGLPATYDEFYEFCRLMKDEHDITPIIWSGMYQFQSTRFIVGDLARDYHGQDSNIFYSFDGEMEIGEVVDGTAQGKMETITSENGYKTYTAMGKYYGLEFLDTIVKNGWYSEDSFKNTVSHTQAQNKFLYSGIVNNAEKIAMLADGDYWYEESRDARAEIYEEYGVDFSDKKIIKLPLPKPKAEMVGEKGVIGDSNSACFVKASIPESKIELAKEFLRFAHTDESLIEYTVTTNTPKTMKYSLSESDKKQLTEFGRSVWQHYEEDIKVFPYSASPVFLSTPLTFTWTEAERLFMSVIDGTPYKNPGENFRLSNKDPKDAVRWFDGMKKNPSYGQDTWNTNYSRYFQ